MAFGLGGVLAMGMGLGGTERLGAAGEAKSSAPAQKAPVEGATSSGGERMGVSVAGFERLEDGRVRLGQVEVDPVRRSLSFPAEVNAREGLVEYAVVTREGKVHEAVFSTRVDPLQVHLGALLLEWGRPDGSGSPTAIRIEVEWATSAGPRRERLERLVTLAQDSEFGPAGQRLAEGPWIYAGKLLAGGTLAARSEGSLVALIEDETALVGNPRPSRVDDQVHEPNAECLPPVGSPVRVEFRAELERRGGPAR
jgi:hypothetical protein